MADQAHEAARGALSLEAKNAYVGMALAWETMFEELERLLEVMPDGQGFNPEATLPLTKPLNPNR